MLDDKDDELTLRDKFAAAALPALITRFNDKVDTKWVAESSITEAASEDATIIAMLAYKIADAMRKARLQTFT